MNFFSSLNAFSQHRFSWFLLFGLTAFFLTCAYTFQHVMKLEPCVMCIYERVTMIAIGLSALIGIINPKVLILRWIGILAWGAGSYKGMMLALEHVGYQGNIFATCSPLIFPEWAPLNKWQPAFFEATGSCNNIQWEFLTLSMPEWLVVIYATSFATAVIISISQFFQVNKINQIRF